VRAIAAVMLWCIACGAHAAPWPVIDSIRFEGNRITRPEVIRRELTLGPGAHADPAELERNRQAVMDLGLFRTVSIESAPQPDGSVALTVKMKEKRFLLPLPRIDTNSDGDLSYGAQLRWANVGGRNHRLNLTVEQGRYPDSSRREREREASLAYTAPFAVGDWALSGRLQSLERVTPLERLEDEEDEDNFQETYHRAEVLAIRDMTRGRPRHGWRIGGGLFLEDQDTSGESAPTADGRSIAAVGVASYDDVRFHVYSETGRRFSARAELAHDGWGSDYGYRHLTARYFESRPWGDRDHQTWHLVGLIGQRSGGPSRRDEFSLGGSSRLRGYDSEYLLGDRVYYGSVEWLKPLRRNWLRGVLMLEAGGTDADRAGLRNASPFASIGLGLRMRLTWFVDLEFELGVAYPLKGGEGVRFFAGAH
jgi:outer membrane protein assembly factor BamA